MIQNIKIEGFQSHKNSYLEFDPGVNVIIGSSDSGKTAILRSLLWVIQNRPGGNAFCSQWANETSVQMKVDNHVITRFRNKNTNNYALDLLKFNAMGTEVPEEIETLLNINDINISNQLDSPFLLSLSAGQTAAHFNKIAHLDVIDVGLRNVKSWISGLTKTISIEEIRVAELEEEQSQYDYLPAMEKAIITLETLHAHLYKMSKDFIDFEKLKLSIIKTNSNIDQYANLLSLEPAVLLTLEQARVIFDKKTIRENLTRSVQNINKTDEEIIAGKGVLKLEKLVTGTFILIQKEKALQNEKRVLTGVVSGIKTTTQTLKTSIARRDELQKEFDENFPEVCPLCGRSD